MGLPFRIVGPRGQGAGPLGTPPIGLLDLYRKAISYGALPRPYIAYAIWRGRGLLQIGPNGLLSSAGPFFDIIEVEVE